MCFGGGGGGQSAAPVINMPQAATAKMPERPERIISTFKPLQPEGSQPGVLPAGTTKRLQEGRSMPRRRGLTAGIAMTQASIPSGGLNL